MKAISSSVGNLLEKIDSKVGYVIFGRSLPITVSAARTPEQLVSDVRKAEQERRCKFSFESVKTWKFNGFQLTEQTIPKFIILLCICGELANILAFFTGFPWFAAPLIFGGIILYLVKVFNDIKHPYGCY